MQQDAHEFLNFLINHISEIILGKKKNRLSNFSKNSNYFRFVSAERQQNTTINNVKSKTTGENGTIHSPPEPTWVHEIFQVF